MKEHHPFTIIAPLNLLSGEGETFAIETPYTLFSGKTSDLIVSLDNIYVRNNLLVVEGTKTMPSQGFWVLVAPDKEYCTNDPEFLDICRQRFAAIDSEPTGLKKTNQIIAFKSEMETVFDIPLPGKFRTESQHAAAMHRFSESQPVAHSLYCLVTACAEVNARLRA